MVVPTVASEVTIITQPRRRWVAEIVTVINVQTFPVRVRIAVTVGLVGMVIPKTPQPKVGDFQDESAVNHAVTGLETTVRTELAAVQVTHSLKYRNRRVI